MKILNFNELDSTNKYVIDHYDELEDFSIVSANYQTKGKGRENRIWLSNKNENILFSYLIKNEKFINKFQLFSICSSVVIMNVIRSLGINNVSIKWPNDVYVNDKKICGILLQGQLPKFFVVGVGLNVNQIDFIGEYRTAPTSVAIELNKKQNINKIKKLIFKELEKMINNFDEYISLAQKNDYLLNKEVMYKNKKVKCLGIMKDGSLKVKINNNIEYISSDEI